MKNLSDMSVSPKAVELIRQLCEVAKTGLKNCCLHGDGSLQVSIPQGDASLMSMADNLRYLIIAQIGIKRWQSFGNKDDGALPDFWNTIISRKNEVTGLGDLGLVVWAGVKSGAECSDFADDISSHWSSQQDECNAVELAWIVQGLVNLSEIGAGKVRLGDVLKKAYEKLLALYNPDTRLFARHSRKGRLNAMSRRIACFADQVYPVLALSNYGRYFNDARSIEIASAVADKVCELQGPMGQWWWHYDSTTGTVAEEYPVFSVHQDGMAPMALLAVDEAAGTDHNKYIDAGLEWLAGPNECNHNMIQSRQGIVWRDIHRREAPKMFRFFRDSLALAGWDRLHRLTGKRWLGYVINKECRPYHLGWILYAWAPLLTQGGFADNSLLKTTAAKPSSGGK